MRQLMYTDIMIMYSLAVIVKSLCTKFSTMIFPFGKQLNDTENKEQFIYQSEETLDNIKSCPI